MEESEERNGVGHETRKGEGRALWESKDQHASFRVLTPFSVRFVFSFQVLYSLEYRFFHEQHLTLQ